MSVKQSLKVLTGVVLVSAALLSGCSAFKDQNQSKDVHPVADKIAGYTLPEGYSEQFSVDLKDYQVVSFEGPTPNCHLYLAQAPKDADVDVADLQQQARKLDGTKPEDVRNVQIVETRTATVRGQEVPVVVGEGINSKDQPYREITVLFEGRGGPALISMSSPVDLWDYTLVEEFLASIE